ncbi:hypothetical protein [Sphaerotilus sp.]|uniref:hypothetical protein n=1 Tax=Sphaerotilus sp. TaxID=2093942 RepID=UPI002ACE1002|nr:hypothetical protein [Sphaerotilus sp.]MDZ7858675.1 hypothetical protein [Sphaerotilus sp.]
MNLKKLASLLVDLEFFCKVALSCALLQQVFIYLLAGRKLSFMEQVLVYWILTSSSHYLFGWLVERGIKSRPNWFDRFCIRKDSVPHQPYPAFSFSGILLGECKAVLSAVVVIAVTRQVDHGNDFWRNFFWFLGAILSAGQTCCFTSSIDGCTEKIFSRSTGNTTSFETRRALSVRTRACRNMC